MRPTLHTPRAYTALGIPVRVSSYSADSGPGSVEFNLGTSNADALTIVVLGQTDIAELEGVAGSIIARWLAGNPGG
jgi:hypothetical protein